MHRVFGRGSGAKATTPNLTDAAANVESRLETLEKSINAKRTEAMKYQQQLKTMRDGPAKRSLKAKALNVLKQMKVLEQQRDMLYNQSFNMSQAAFAIQNVKDTQTTVKAMKAGVKEFKKETKHMNLDDIEDINDDLFDMLDLSNEIGGALGRSDILNNIDETELDAELEALGTADDFDSFIGADTAPSVPSADIGGSNVPSAPTAATSGNVPLDEFGLPQI
nr:charged multivesicular body protein 5 [Hymenolepis microstoma]